jgi:hypothetical protein
LTRGLRPPETGGGNDAFACSSETRDGGSGRRMARNAGHFPHFLTIDLRDQTVRTSEWRNQNPNALLDRSTPVLKISRNSLVGIAASLPTRLQQKSQPRNARREIFFVTRAETTRTLRLCRKLDPREGYKYAPNGDEIDATETTKTTTLSIS